MFELGLTQAIFVAQFNAIFYYYFLSRIARINQLRF